MLYPLHLNQTQLSQEARVLPGSTEENFKEKKQGVAFVAQWLTKPTSIHQDVGSNPWPCLVG